jgi:hypothetical protein
MRCYYEYHRRFTRRRMMMIKAAPMTSATPESPVRA